MSSDFGADIFDENRESAPDNADATPPAGQEAARDAAAGGAGDMQTLFSALVSEFGWTPLYEGENVIALTREGANITLEPGGQFELSGAVFSDLHQTRAETLKHVGEIGTLCQRLGLGALGLGYQPELTRDQVPWMPKARYRIMGAYMQKKGQLGLDMMKSTATVQVNLDFSSEADMVRKLRVSLALQPVATVQGAYQLMGELAHWLMTRG